ncbi:MAG: prepilin-type N-terminal cleavage/methylation domain-containing protein [Lachnobacterium sp.]|nr:prepilin-type N-terminal cleavage/methylation domain-containing protein [Lachnobacterium sp.]
MQKDNRGITLIELIIAIAISTIIVGAATFLLSTAQKNYSSASDTIDLQSEAQILMEQMGTWIMEGNRVEVNAAGDKLTVYQIPRKVTTNRPTGAEALKTDASKRVFWLSNKLNGKTMLYMKKFDGIADPDHDTTDVADADAILDNCIGEYVTSFSAVEDTSKAKVTITLEFRQGTQKYSITNEFKLRNALQ